jgi:hypothetical protein
VGRLPSFVRRAAAAAGVLEEQPAQLADDVAAFVASLSQDDD